MVKVLKRISEYTFDDLRQYCELNGLDFEAYKYMFHYWAIFQHDDDLFEFIKQHKNSVVTVTGCICLDKQHHKVKPKTLSLFDAFDKMITTDIQDYCVVLSPGGTYYVMALHARGHNVFKFRLDDDKNRTTTASD